MYTPSLHCDWQFLWYYECIGLPAAHLDSCLIPSVWFPYPFQGDIRTSAVPYNIIISNLAKFSDWGMPLFPRPIGHRDIVCCVCKHIDHFRPYIYFPAQSLHFRFGSVAPCPTLKSDVTASTPRTRYRRLAKPYLTGFPALYYQLTKTDKTSVYQWKSAMLISQPALHRRCAACIRRFER